MNHYRDFVSVADICDAIKLLWIKKSKGEFNIASGKATYVKNIVKFFCKKYKKKPIFVDNGKSYLVGDIKKIKKLGWIPKYSIKESIENTIKYLVNNKWVLNKRK